MVSRDSLVEKAHGALMAGAIGDALGMPTQMISREEASLTYGWVADFLRPVDWHPVSRGLAAAAITDDTEQTLLLCDRIIASPESFDETAWARDLMGWEKAVKQRGHYDLLGPSTKRALVALLAGEEATVTGRYGNTNGAAMRAAPVGISTPPEPVWRLVDRMEETCRVTHNTGSAISAAAAVAGAVSAGLDGADTDAAIELAIAAADEGGRRGITYMGEPVVEKISYAVEMVASGVDRARWHSIADILGTTSLSHESVPMAFAVFKASAGDAWAAAVTSANLGGDTDTIGAIAAAMVGSVSGLSSLPEAKVSVVQHENRLELSERVNRLIEIRLNRY